MNPNKSSTLTLKQESLLDFIVGKHTKKMNLESCKQRLDSPEGIELAITEIKTIKKQIVDFIDEVNKKASTYRTQIEENKYQIVDLTYNSNNLLSQFYNNNNTVSNAHLWFCIQDTNESSKKDIRLEFSYDNQGNFGWRNKKEKTDFYSSAEITIIWLEKFFKKVLN